MEARLSADFVGLAMTMFGDNPGSASDHRIAQIKMPFSKYSPKLHGDQRCAQRSARVVGSTNKIGLSFWSRRLNSQPNLLNSLRN